MATRKKSRKRRNPSRILVAEITPADVGVPYIKRSGKIFHTGFMGGVRRVDIGKRVYLVGDILQVENDEQRDRRLAAARRNPSDLAVREKFDRCVASVRAKSGKRHLTKAGRYARISSPEAVCAKSIRRTSRKQLAKISAEGRSLAAARRHARGYVRSRKTGRLVRRPASRMRLTAIQRRHQVRRVMHQQALAKRRARMVMNNPSQRFKFVSYGGGVYGAKKGKFTIALLPYRNVMVAHIYHANTLLAEWAYFDKSEAAHDITEAKLRGLLVKR